MAEPSISLHAVGDVAAFFRNPESMFVHTAAVLNEADVTFGQNERHYTDRFTEEHDLVPGVPNSNVTRAAHAAALKLGGFDVMSFASNHCMDMGPDAMLDTIRALKENGFAVIGVGKNIEEARKPAILERKGVKVAFLAYVSVIRPGYEAGIDKPGCAPMRAWTIYQQLDYQPATPPNIISLAHREDVKAMIEDIKKVRPLVDVVVISMHWGIHMVPAVIAMYQKEVAHEAIDAGADLIVGHHSHIPKGIEVYHGKPVFYCLGNFAVDSPRSLQEERRRRTPEQKLYTMVDTDPEYAEWYAYPAECRRSMIVKCRMSRKGIERVSFLPVLINNKAQPVIVSPGDKNFAEAIRYIKDVTPSQGLDTRFSVDGSEVVIELA